MAKGHGGGLTTTKHGPARKAEGKNATTTAPKGTADRSAQPGGQADVAARREEEIGREIGGLPKKTARA